MGAVDIDAVLARFWSHVDRSAGDNACWPWVGARHSNGYGVLKVAGRMRIAHRWLLGALRGHPLSWPEEHGCHHCDNPLCCNPSHLYVGTHQTNMRDAIERGRLRTPVAEANRAKTQCKRGHPFDVVNTIFRATGKRGCRTCERPPMCSRGHPFTTGNTVRRGSGRRRICRTCEQMKATAAWAP